MKNILPDKPSELIRLAIGDMKLVELDPDYSFDMGDWHTGTDSKCTPCQVCMAGAVMAKTLNVSIGENIDITDKGYNGTLKDKVNTHNKLWAINSIRLGYLEDVEDLLGIETGAIDFGAMYKALPFLESKPYDNMMARNLPRFYKDMLTIADEFEKLGY